MVVVEAEVGVTLPGGLNGYCGPPLAISISGCTSGVCIKPGLRVEYCWGMCGVKGPIAAVSVCPPPPPTCEGRIF